MKKYSVNTAIWLATAIMTFEKYLVNPSIREKDVYFKQADIKKRAQGLTEKNVDAARVCWWVNADNVQSTKNYLRQDSKYTTSNRRLSGLDEFQEKTYPEELDDKDTFIIDGTTYHISDLMHFLRYSYPNILGIDIIEDTWWPSLSEYDPGLTADQYYNLFLDESVTKKEWLEALYDMYRMPDHLATCSDLEDKYGNPFSRYNRYLTSLAQRIMEETKCKPTEDQANSAYWPVLFQGKNVVKDKTHRGSYCWKLRKPVIEAMEKIITEGLFDEGQGIEMKRTTVHYDHNMILYGPPGTGKTYHSVIYAVAICEGKSIEEVEGELYSEVLNRYNELREKGRIAFTTFHQSFGYEEFIEGIRPIMADDEKEGSLEYEIRDGIFKKICDTARTPEGIVIDHNASIWFIRLKDKGPNDLKTECFRDGEIRFDGPEEPDDDFSWVYSRLSKMSIGDYVLSYGGQSVFVDAIGVITDDEPIYDQTKGSYKWLRKVKWILKDVSIDVKEINSNRYLPNFIIATMSHMKVSDLLRVVEKNEGQGFRENSKPYVFIIDEINRGNISKIFGELITLIEDTKREGAEEAMEAILPYSGVPFSVPNNVYIIGTMNTADRSIALMDTALRRRFKFEEMMPNSKILEDLKADSVVVGNEELNVAKMLDVINERIEYLFDREHTIGHAFFTKLKNDPSIRTLAGIFEKNVIPLLQEYFYEDYEKIQLVLGDNTKPDEFKFILDKPLIKNEIFNGNPDHDLPDKGYSIQHEAFLKLQSYKLIGRDL